MNEFESTSIEALFDKSKYSIETLADEISADRHCAALLKHFHHDLLGDHATEPLEAGSMAAGADYFLRDFMVDHCRENIFSATAESVRKFAGHWYIINTLEPNLIELVALLKGTASFYRYCATHSLIDAVTADEIQQACADTEFYRERIESFHAISDDGFSAWVQACPLK